MGAPTLKSYIKKITGLPRWARYPIYFIAFALVALTAIAIFAPGLPPEEKAKNKRSKVLEDVTTYARSGNLDSAGQRIYIEEQITSYDTLLLIPENDPIKKLATMHHPEDYYLRYLAYKNGRKRDSLKRLGLIDY